MKEELLDKLEDRIEYYEKEKQRHSEHKGIVNACDTVLNELRPMKEWVENYD